MWSTSIIVGYKALVEATHAFVFVRFDETIEQIAIQQTFSLFIDTYVND